MHKLAPKNLRRTKYSLRNLQGQPPKPNTNYLKQSFCYSGTQELKGASSIGYSKRNIRQASDLLDSYTAILKAFLYMFFAKLMILRLFKTKFTLHNKIFDIDLKLHLVQILSLPK